MRTDENLQIVKGFFEAMGRGDRQTLRALAAEDIAWVIPGTAWPLAGTYRGHAGLEELLGKISQIEISRPQPPDFVAQANRVIVVGIAEGMVKATNKSFVDHWVFDITIVDGKLAAIREYIDTQALARASAA